MLSSSTSMTQRTCTLATTIMPGLLAPRRRHSWGGPCPPGAGKCPVMDGLTRLETCGLLITAFMLLLSKVSIDTHEKPDNHICYFRLRVGRMEPSPELQQALRWRSVVTQKTDRLPWPLLRAGWPGSGELEGRALPWAPLPRHPGRLDPHPPGHPPAGGPGRGLLQAGLQQATEGDSA